MSATQTITIDQTLFMMAFANDDDYRNPSSISNYLDSDSGEVFFVYPDDDAAELDGMDANNNQMLRGLVENNPAGYLKIPSLSHGQCHNILKSFLDSEWTDDVALKRRALLAYLDKKSIGFWLKNVPEQAATAYFRYAEKTSLEMAEQWLGKKGLSFVWG